MLSLLDGVLNCHTSHLATTATVANIAFLALL